MKRAGGKTPRWVTRELRGPLNSLLNQGNDRAQAARLRTQEWGIDTASRYFFDQETGLLTFTFAEREVHCPFQFLGSHDSAEGTWMWAWANDGFLPALRRDSQYVHELGHAVDSKLLVEPVVPVSREDADCLALLAIGCHEFDAFYKAPDGDRTWYLCFGDPQ